ncbi:MAG: hypothetical protein KA792_08280 [Bacteroidales bacterium]|nr:hypothetical protein [Bacteroidales bacterium]
MKKTSEYKHLWVFPWSYRESFIFTSGLFLTGIVLEIISGGKGIIIPSFPYNLLILFGFIFFLIILHFFLNIHIKKWLNNIPAAIAAILSLFFLSVFMGFIPQKDIDNSFLTITGLTHIHRSWAFSLIFIFLLTVLGLTIIKRLNSYKIRNIAFLLNHIGLFIILISAGLSSSDFKKFKMRLVEGQTINTVYDENNNFYNLNFGIRLSKFNIDEYEPQFLLINNKGEIINKKHKYYKKLKPGISLFINEFRIDIQKFFNASVPFNSTFRPIDTIGAVFSAKVEIFDKKNKLLTKGWVSSKSIFDMMPKILNINKDIMLTLSLPAPKRFSSLICINPDNNPLNIKLEVNKPYKYKNWKIYQTGYDENFGKWSKISFIELIQDKWISGFYFGTIMLFIGTLLLLFIGKKTIP